MAPLRELMEIIKFKFAPDINMGGLISTWGEQENKLQTTQTNVSHTQLLLFLLIIKIITASIIGIVWQYRSQHHVRRPATPYRLTPDTPLGPEGTNEYDPEPES